MEGVLKSWAVPKGPSLDPADKRLAMQVEDHPVSYFDFEGIIPEGNYGAGTVMVWEMGTWEPLSPETVNGKYLPATEAEAAAMLRKGDFKFRLYGKRLRGDFALIHIKSRRSGSKGTEWLLIKKQDQFVVPGFNIDEYETSVLSDKTMAEIAGDEGSAEWQSHKKASRGRAKAAWLAESLAKLDKKKVKAETPASAAQNRATKVRSQRLSSPPSNAASSISALNNLKGAVKREMPSAIQPMLASVIEKPFDDPNWLFEIKWDGYRAVSFIENDKVRLVSRNQNDLTGRYPELQALPKFLNAESAILDGEVVVLDEHGRPSFSLMQQRTGIRSHGRQAGPRSELPIVYYVFDILYLDGYDLRRVNLDDRKRLLRQVLRDGEIVRYSDDYAGQGLALFNAAKEKDLEGIIATQKTADRAVIRAPHVGQPVADAPVALEMNYLLVGGLPA